MKYMKNILANSAAWSKSYKEKYWYACAIFIGKQSVL